MPVNNQDILIGAIGLAFLALWLVAIISPNYPRKTYRPKKHSIFVIKDILSSLDPEPVAVWVAIGSTIWGLFVGSDWGTTTSFPYKFSDNTAGLIIGVMGVIMSISMVLDLHRTYAFSVLLLSLAWGIVAWGGGTTSGWHSAAWIVYGGLSAMSGWLSLRLWADDRRLSVSTSNTTDTGHINE